jgi:deoxyribose-phosphate aldolase
VALRPHELAKALEAVLLRPTATFADVDETCAMARDRHLAAACVLPCHVARAEPVLRGTDVKLVAMIGYPFGADVSAVKVAAATAALADGADELEVVMGLSAFLSGDVNGVRDDLARVVKAARLHTMTSGRRVPLVRAVIETSYLDDRRIRLAARVVRAAEVDMVVTSTGLGPRTVTLLDVELLREELGGATSIKAAGGVRTRQEAEELIAAGAHRVGSANIDQIVAGAGAAA